MSQITKRSSGSGPLPPEVATEYDTDIGVAIPVANILNILGGSTSDFTDNGIQVIADPDGGNTVVVQETARLVGSGASFNANPVDLITFDLTPFGVAVFRFEFYVTGLAPISGDGVGYTMFASAKTDGATATVVATPFSDNDEDASLLLATLVFTSSGNNIILRATGVAGLQVRYKAIGTYVVVQ